MLVVDDTRENLALIGQFPRPVYHMGVGNSGQRALQVADFERRPDLILLDVMMPEMDGYQVLQRLREQAITLNIQVIFVTVMNADEDEEHGLALGAVDYVTNPLSRP